jgi:hypothetical protein
MVARRRFQIETVLMIMRRLEETHATKQRWMFDGTLSLLSFFERKEYASLLIILRHINDPLVQEVPE